MRLEEILQEAQFGGGHIGDMAAGNVPSRHEDPDALAAEERATAVNDRKRKIRSKIRKAKRRNKAWTQEEIWDASPSTAEHDLGQSDAALAGVMRGSDPYPGNQGI